MIRFRLLHLRATPEMLGYLPGFIDPKDPDGAVAQLDKNYQHGGGWKSFSGFEMRKEDLSIKYPGDPAYPPLAQATLRDETIVMYPHGWVAVIQKDGSFDIARMD